MICPSCSKEIPDKIKFCPECGARLGPSSQEASESGVASSALDPTGAPQPEAAIILRRSPQLTASLTKFTVFIDERRAGTIGNNETERFNISPGVHTFYVSLDDFKSKKLSVNLRPGESLRLACWAKAFGLGVTIGFE
jgi:hypothetical protein